MFDIFDIMNQTYPNPHEKDIVPWMTLDNTCDCL